MRNPALYIQVLVIACMVALCSCPTEEPEDDIVLEPEEIVLIELYDDAYMNGECSNPSWGPDPIQGWARGDSLILTREINDQGAIVYQLDIENFIFSALGDGWTCQARIFYAQPLLP
jgi:hypothetical protein